MTSIQHELDSMLRRCVALHGFTYKEVEAENGEKTVVKIGKDEAVRDFLKTLATASASSREMADKIIAAWDDKSGKLQESLNAARIEAIGNFIASESVFKSAFFSTVTLAADEEPFYTNETANETRIGSMGEDGTPEQVRVVKPYDRTAVGLYAVSSDKVRVKTMDIYKGDVSQVAWNTLNIARDLTFKLDRIHYNLLKGTLANGGCFGAFSYEASNANKSTRVYLAHSGIDTTHLPTTNDVINGTTAGPTGTRFTVRYYDSASATPVTFRPAVLLAVVDYADSWANVLPGGGRLVPSGDIIMPSSDIIAMAQYMDLTKVSDVQTQMQTEVQQNGYTSLTLFGKRWRFIADVTIPTGTCYPRFNILPGLSYEKPSWDKEFTERNDVENWEQRWQRKAYGLVIPAQWRPRAMRISYDAD